MLLTSSPASRWDPHGQEKLPLKAIRVTVGPSRQGKTATQGSLRHGGTPTAKKNCLSPSRFLVVVMVMVMVGSCAENKSRASRGKHIPHTQARIRIRTPDPDPDPDPRGSKGCARSETPKKHFRNFEKMPKNISFSMQIWQKSLSEKMSNMASSEHLTMLERCAPRF